MVLLRVFVGPFFLSATRAWSTTEIKRGWSSRYTCMARGENLLYTECDYLALGTYSAAAEAPLGVIAWHSVRLFPRYGSHLFHRIR